MSRDLSLTPDDGAWFMISSNALHWELQLLLGKGDIEITGGGGGATSIDRPSRKSLTVFNGYPQWAMTIPVMIDAWTDQIETPDPNLRKPPPKYDGYKKKKNRKKARQRWREYRDKYEPSNVAKYVEILIDLAEPDAAGKEPPSLRIYSNSLPDRLNGQSWRIVQIEWGKRLFHPRSGNLKRQELSIGLLEDTGADEYKARRRRKHQRGKRNKNKKRYTVKRGDTLQKIAAKFYGDYTKWTKIAKENDIDNPRRLKAGTVLKIP